MTATAPDIERKRLGEHADDVLFLRACGLTVAPFHGGFRVNGEVVGDEGLQKRAELERDKRAGQAFQAAARPSKINPGEEGADAAKPAKARVAAPPEAAPEDRIVVLDLGRLHSETYRRYALAECAQACVAIVESFPEGERAGWVDVIGGKLIDAIEARSEGR